MALKRWGIAHVCSVGERGGRAREETGGKRGREEAGRERGRAEVDGKEVKEVKEEEEQEDKEWIILPPMFGQRGHCL